MSAASAASVDQFVLNFSPTATTVMNVAIGLVMFGVALDLRVSDFVRVFVSPTGRGLPAKGPIIGLLSQFVLLPAATFVLVLLIRPHPSIALGMMLVAACPGGNLSNFFTHLAGGNTALSVSMTAVSTAAALVMTPFNLAFWGSLYGPTATILHAVSVDPLSVFGLILMILGVPLTIGMVIAYRFPKVATKLRRPFRIGSIIVFLSFILVSLVGNYRNFVEAIGIVALVVMLHNATALSLGYGMGRLTRLTRRDTRAVTIEVGIQNSGLGLTLVFNFFGGLGGMALITAWWGVWHIIAGMIVACVWSRLPIAGEAPPETAGTGS